jgi:CheY-like chemotaxis protein
MTYLVVDDSRFARKVLLKSLTPQVPDAEILQAENGQLALDIVKDQHVDVVFLDLTMPVMDGYEALPLMIAAKPGLNVIVVSADVQPQAKEQVLALGAKYHIQKPINADKMKEILGSL